MGWKNREIEKKFVVEGSLKKAIAAVSKAIIWDSEISDASHDYYWHSKDGLNADFLRLRYMPSGSGELTLKQADRGTNTNRVEIDVEVSDPDQCRALLRHLLGPSAGTVFKRYHVFFIRGGATVSLYQVRGDRRVFLEVEARSLRGVNLITERLRTVLRTKVEQRSLYQIFIGRNLV